MKILPQVDVDRFRSWAEAAITTQQQDIDRLSGSVGRIELDMQLFKDFMDEIRRELASDRQRQEQMSAESLASICGELDGLRQQASSNAKPGSEGTSELSNRTFDALAKGVQLVGRKVDEIDELKRELYVLRSSCYF
jgi:hypothetical protein